MKQLVSLSAILILLLISCISEDLATDLDCNDCYPLRPKEAEVAVSVTINRENTRVPLEIYRDNIDDGFIEFRDTANTATHYLWLATKQEYAVKATYKKNGQTIHAVDATNLDIKHITTQCDTACWIATGTQLKVELEY